MGWTSHACVARFKHVTRRNWKSAYAARFMRGTIHTISDKDFRYGGKIIGRIEIIKTPYLEPVSQIPASDYVKEGFKYYDQHPYLLPAKFQTDLKKHGMKTMKDWFAKWPGYDTPFVVRFKILEITKEAEENLQQLLKQAA
jgi:hypothetical protein